MGIGGQGKVQLHGAVASLKASRTGSSLGHLTSMAGAGEGQHHRRAGAATKPAFYSSKECHKALEPGRGVLAAAVVM